MFRLSPMMKPTLLGLRPQDVFATKLYTGNGGTQTITNGLDLASKGGLVWAKPRDSVSDHTLWDTARGAKNYLSSDTTGAEISASPAGVSFSNSGFGLDSDYNGENGNSKSIVAWSFRRASKFFDVITYTGNGNSLQSIPHALGIKPGAIIVKSRSSAGQDWPFWHRSLTGTQTMNLNRTDSAIAAETISATADETTFRVGNYSSSNLSRIQYVAYLFAHDPDTTNGIIQCGIYTEPASGSVQVNLGWPPQFFLVKPISSGSWYIFDSTRGFKCGLVVNSSNAESEFGSNYFMPNSAGISIGYNFFGANANVIYLAIRAPV